MEHNVLPEEKNDEFSRKKKKNLPVRPHGDRRIINKTEENKEYSRKERRKET